MIRCCGVTVAAMFGAERLDELSRFRRRNVLEDDLQSGEVADNAVQHAVDEHGLTVEHVDVRIGHFAVDAEHHADALHPLQRRIDVADVGDPARAVGRRARWIELGRDPHAVVVAALKRRPGRSGP